MRGSDGRFAAFHLMTEAEERRRGRRNVRLSMLPHYPSSLSSFFLLFHSFHMLLLFLLLFPFSFSFFVSSSSPSSSRCSSLTLPSSSSSSSASLTPSVSSHHLIGRLPGIVLIFVPSNTCHKHTNTNNGSILSVCLCVVVNYQRRADVDYSGRFVR